MKRCLILFLTLILSCCPHVKDASVGFCTPGPVYNFVVDPSYDAWHYRLLQLAADHWSAATQGIVKINLEQKEFNLASDFAIVNVLPEGQRPDIIGLAAKSTFGWRIFIASNKVLSDHIFYMVALHEIGHTLGLQHTKSGVMRASVDTDITELQDSDLLEFRKLKPWCPR